MKKSKSALLLCLVCAMLLSFLTACGSASNTSSGSSSGSSTGDASSSEDASAESTDTSSDEDATTTSTSSEPQYGGSVTLYYTSDINASYDQAMGSNCGYNLWMESLFAYDVSLSDTEYDVVDDSYTYEQVTGQLAESYEVDEEACTITVKIRENIYFQDKEPFNGRQFLASDVKWSYDRALGIGSGYDTPASSLMDWSSTLFFIESVETDGDYTVIFHCSELSELQMNTFLVTALNCIGPEWDELTEDQQSSYEYACGTGPYILEELVSGVSVKLVKNENYYGTDSREGYEGNQLPYLDEIDFIYVSDSTNALTQFVSGDLDFIGARTNILSDSELAQLAASLEEGTDYYIGTFVGRTEYVTLRCNCEPFNDINVRMALQNAVDLEAIMADYYGLDLSLAGIFSTAQDCAYTDWPDELTAQYSYDPELAAELLEEAGYGDGLEFTVVLSNESNTELYSYINSQYFAPLGISMDIDLVSSDLEGRTIGQDETDTRCVGATGIIGITSATYGLQSVKMSFLQENNAASWNCDTYFESLVEKADASKTFDEFYSVCTEIDEYYLNQHWTCYMTGATEVYELYSSRLCGLAEGDRLYNQSVMPTLLTYMWVSE